MRKSAARIGPDATCHSSFVTTTCVLPSANSTTKRSRVINSLTEFEQFFKDGGGFAWVHWAGTHEQEEEMAKRFETTIRCIPLPDQIPAGAQGAGQCILTGQPSAQRVVMARAY